MLQMASPHRTSLAAVHRNLLWGKDLLRGYHLGRLTREPAPGVVPHRAYVTADEGSVTGPPCPARPSDRASCDGAVARKPQS